ncbi:hypothetical protein LCGC14_2524240, partial [marine sediment metagenome]
MDYPEPTYLEDEFIFQWEALDMQLVFARFFEDKGDLKANVQPSNISDAGTLPPEKLNLDSARSMKTYANTLGGYGLLEAADWFEALTQACKLARKRYDEGEPAVVLSEVSWRGTPAFLISPYVTQHGTTILFGDGGVSKSLHALALGVMVATGSAVVPDCSVEHPANVLYIDYEADAGTHAERLEGLCAGANITTPDNVHYMRRVASIGESVREVRKHIALNEIGFVIVDSIGAASGGDPEKADTVIRAFNAMRAFEVPVLAIHHVTKDQRDKTKPFGSVFAPNLARLTWALSKEQDAGADVIRVRLTNHKANFGRLSESRGHAVRFEQDDEGFATIFFEYASFSSLPPINQASGVKYALVKALQ